MGGAFFVLVQHLIFSQRKECRDYEKQAQKCYRFLSYAVITNLPNPKIDIENDKRDILSSDTDDNYEESEAACLSPDLLVAEKKYIIATYWHDFRTNATNDSGWITASPEMSNYFPFGGDLNTSQEANATFSIYYGAQGGYQ